MLKLMRKWMKGSNGFVYRNRGRILYYGGIAAALIIIAVAAEEFRADEVVPKTDMQAVQAAGMENKQPEPEEKIRLNMDGLKLQRGYSEVPEWNKHLGLWETHAASDYQCEDGLVLSLSDGRITAIGKNAFYGEYIEVESGEYRLRYASLQPEIKLSEGMEVPAGTKLGMTGTSMPGECYAGAHLHLEIYKNGKQMNPEMFDTKNQAYSD